MVGNTHARLLGLVVGLLAPTALAEGLSPDDTRPRSARGDDSGPSLGFTAMSGIAVANCGGVGDACREPLSPAPSLRALVLYQPNRAFGVGLLGRVASYHWTAGYTAFDSAATHGVVESTVTTGLVGPAVRFTTSPSWVVSPVVEAAVGLAFQSESRREFFGCSNGVSPGGEIAAGGSARFARWGSLLVMANASMALADICGVSDGPPVTPSLGIGLGLHAGISFDVGLGGARSTATDTAKLEHSSPAE